MVCAEWQVIKIQSAQVDKTCPNTLTLASHANLQSTSRWPRRVWTQSLLYFTETLGSRSLLISSFMQLQQGGSFPLKKRTKLYELKQIWGLASCSVHMTSTWLWFWETTTKPFNSSNLYIFLNSLLLRETTSYKEIKSGSSHIRHHTSQLHNCKSQSQSQL